MGTADVTAVAAAVSVSSEGGRGQSGRAAITSGGGGDGGGEGSNNGTGGVGGCENQNGETPSTAKRAAAAATSASPPAGGSNNVCQWGGGGGSVSVVAAASAIVSAAADAVTGAIPAEGSRPPQLHLRRKRRRRWSGGCWRLSVPSPLYHRAPQLSWPTHPCVDAPTGRKTLKMGWARSGAAGRQPSRTPTPRQRRLPGRGPRECPWPRRPRRQATGR